MVGRGGGGQAKKRGAPTNLNHDDDDDAATDGETAVVQSVMRPTSLDMTLMRLPNSLLYISSEKRGKKCPFSEEMA